MSKSKDGKKKPKDFEPLELSKLPKVEVQFSTEGFTKKK